MRYQSAPVIPEERQETTRERAARQRLERQAELTFTQEDYDRWARNRERVLREREQVTSSETSRSEIIETSILDDAMDEKWLTVPKGQFTFDNEGNDIESSPYFSRKVHVPHNPGGVVVGQSGVTIGRGLDVGNPPTGATGQSPSKLDLKELFQVAELSPELSDWLLSVEGLKKGSALQSLNNSGLDEDELTLTRKQQHLMFNVVYEFMEEKTRILLTKPDVQAKFGVVDWDNLPRNVKDVLVDLTYRGDNSPRTREGFVPALVGFNDGEHFKDIMSNENPLWQGVNSERRQSRWDYVRL